MANKLVLKVKNGFQDKEIIKVIEIIKFEEVLKSIPVFKNKLLKDKIWSAVINWPLSIQETFSIYSVGLQG